ncbi:sensor histidine kinase [Inhella sp.]|uniref:sensor histidine kinase n=1 Tax=Inhella sp. TaxID=1921806 RepID=UPI0035B4477D
MTQTEAPLSSLLEPVTPSTAPLLVLPVFELCHVGVVLRALLGVQGLLALLLAALARSPLEWMDAFMSASTVSVPALMAWLVVVCGLQVRLAAWPLLRVRLALGALGALCAWAPWWLGAHFLDLAQAEPVSLFRGSAVAACGATAATLLVQALVLRARAQAPMGMQARWVELQARIRPHFLFNTLNTAIALVRVSPQQAEQVLEDLGELFQAALAPDEQACTLADEIELARRYLDIEQLRFGARLRLHWELDPSCGGARVPPLLLQPLVENAVRYGVEPNEEGGELWVRTRRRAGGVELKVCNSLGAPGSGGHGLALANVRERLALLHDVAATMQIEASPRQYCVRITLPL